MNNIEPSQATFNDVEQMAIDILKQKAPSVMTKTGSVVKELIVRPLSYLVAWATSNMDAVMKNYDLTYLAKSQSTDNIICDNIASTFFVTRNKGTRSKGLITVTVSMPIVTIPRGSVFSVNGINVRTIEQCVVTSSALSSNTFTSVAYILSTPIDGGRYIASIPVEADEIGAIEIPAGADVSMQFTCNGLENAELTSAITGGSDIETDAKLINRAGLKIASTGIGSYYGILSKLNTAPVTVLSMALAAGEDRAIGRGRYNTTNINPGGVVDCYIKTVNQPTTAYVKATCNDEYIIIQDKEYANILAVNHVIINEEVIDSVTVSFESNDPDIIDADSARLSTSQVTKIQVKGVEDGTPALVSITYMPYIDIIQEFLDRDEEKFIGQNIKVKAAVPVMVSVDCCITSEQQIAAEDITRIKRTITDKINSYAVGTSSINYSDLRLACTSVLPNIDLRLPCTFGCHMYLKDGSLDAFYSNTGILDISDTVNAGYWDYATCYFTTYEDNVRVEII